MLTVCIREKDGEERQLVFDKEEVTIGRAQGSDIVLPRNNISKRHARLVDKDDKVVVVDLRSTNGTYLNGRRITAPEILSAEDKVYIGDFIIRLEFASADAIAAEAQPDAPLAEEASSDVDQGGTTFDVGAAAAANVAMDEAIDALESLESADGANEPPTAADVPDELELPDPFEAEPADLGDASSDAGEAVEEAEASDGEDGEDGEDGAGSSDKSGETLVAWPTNDSGAEAMDSDDASVVDMPPLSPGSPLSEAVAKVSRKLDEALGEDVIGQPVSGKRFRALSGHAQEAVDALFRAGELGDVQPGAVHKAVMTEYLGLGALAAWIGDDSVHRVQVNGPSDVLVQRDAGLTQAEAGFSSPAALERVVDRLIEQMGHDPRLLPPVVAGVLPSGTAVRIVRPPVASGGSVLTLDKPHQAGENTPHALLEAGVLSHEQSVALGEAIAGGRSVAVVGSSSVDVSRVLDGLSYFVPDAARVALVESARRLAPPHVNVVRLDRTGLQDAGEELADVVASLAVDRVVVDGLATGDAPSLAVMRLSGFTGTLLSAVAPDAAHLLERLAFELAVGMPEGFARQAHGLAGRLVDLVVEVGLGDDGVASVTRVVSVDADGDGFSFTAVGS